MTMTSITRGREATNTKGFGRSTGFMNRIRIFLARSRTEEQLARLDDRLLADIGLKRSEISRMVWGN
jgi:uncharacterized protein YjiS (DUF1127 family)